MTKLSPRIPDMTIKERITQAVIDKEKTMKENEIEGLKEIIDHLRYLRDETLHLWQEITRSSANIDNAVMKLDNIKDAEVWGVDGEPRHQDLNDIASHLEIAALHIRSAGRIANNSYDELELELVDELEPELAKAVKS